MLESSCAILRLGQVFCFFFKSRSGHTSSSRVSGAGSFEKEKGEEEKPRHDYVPRRKGDLAKALVGRHAKLYRARAQIQKLNQELNGILDQIVECRRVGFPESK